MASAEMEQQQKKCLDYMSKLEESAQDIISDKEQIVSLSKRSNTLREAKRALQTELKKDKPTSKTWLCFGNMFIKCPTPKALSIVEKDETLMNEEIERLRDGLKPKVENMRNLEGKPPTKFNLKPLSKEEASAMKDILPTVH